MKKSEKATTILLSFLIPIVVAILIFAKLNIYPGGRFTILTYDMAEQYMPLIASLRYLTKRDCSLNFSMFGGLGISYISYIAYYMADPLVWLTVFVPLKNLADAIYFITLIKFGLCGMSFSLYIFYGLRNASHKYMTLILSISYALMAYNVFYSMSLMWMNGVILLPVILIGIEDMLRGKQGGIYIIGLTSSLFMCYYLTYMTGIFTVLYVLYRLVCTDGNKKTRIVFLTKYTVNSLVALGLSMPIVLPAIKYTAMGKLAEKSIEADHLIRVTPIRILRNLLPDGEYFMQNEGAPQLYCGLFALLLVAVFFISRNIRIREKLMAAGILLAYFLSFMLVPLDRVWHGFRDPVCFPARYAYTFVCFMLIVAFRALDTDAFVNIIKKTGNIDLKYIFPFFLVVLMTEFYFSGATIVMYLNDNSHYRPRIEYTSTIIQTQKMFSQLNDDNLYRMLCLNPYTLDDGFMFGFNDIANFSSSYNYGVHSFLGAMGYNFKNQVLKDNGTTPVMNSLLAVKYYIGNPLDGLDSQLVTKNSKYSLNYNPFSLPVGYLIEDKDVDNAIFSDNPFTNQNMLVSGMLNKDIKIYKANTYTIRDISNERFARESLISLLVENDGPVWLYFPRGNERENEEHDIDTTIRVSNRLNCLQAEYVMEIDGTEYDFMMDDAPYCVCIGNYCKGDKLNIRSHSTAYYKDPYIVTEDKEVYRESVRELSKNTLNVTEHGNGRISGSITGIAGKQLVLSLPYLTGYNISLDDNPIEYRKYNDAMISVSVPEGYHKIIISYYDINHKIGVIIASVTTFAYIFTSLIIHRINNHIEQYK